MQTIKKIGILSMAKVQAIISIILGFIIGIIYAMAMVIAGAVSGSGAFGAMTGLLALLSIIGFPIIYGIAGFVFGIITAAIYNLVAGWIGGIEIELK